MTDGAKVTVTGDAGIKFNAIQTALRRTSPAAVLRAANHAGGEIARTVYEKHGGGKGALARSFLPAAFVDVPGKIAAGAFSDSVQANILDQGGTIRPKTVRNLAIPISAQAKGKWPRNWPKDKLFMIIAGGKRLLVEAISNRKVGNLRIHYELVPKVTIHGSGYLAIAADRAQPKVQEILALSVEAATYAR